MSDSPKYSLEDLAAHHLIGAKADEDLFGLKLEADGSVTAARITACVNVAQKVTGPGHRERAAAWVPKDALKNLQLRAKIEPQEIEGAAVPVQFPDWHERLNEVAVGPAAFTLRINAELLRELLDTVRDSLGLKVALLIEFREPEGPVVLRAEDEDRELVALVAPMKATSCEP